MNGRASTSTREKLRNFLKIDDGILSESNAHLNVFFPFLFIISFFCAIHYDLYVFFMSIRGEIFYHGFTINCDQTAFDQYLNLIF